MSWLIKKISDYKSKCKNNKTFLELCETGNTDDVYNFLSNTPKELLNINTTYPNYVNGYLLAARKGNVALLQLLENYGINVEQVNANTCENAFLIAVWWGNKKVLDHLKDRVNMNKLDISGNNAYILASVKGYTDIMEYLDDKLKINVYHTNYYGDDAFTIHKHICMTTSNKEILKNMRKSVIYLAKNEYDISSTGNRNTIADVYYQLYYNYETFNHYVDENEVINCEYCGNAINDNNSLLKCNHEHLYHVYCFIKKATRKSCNKYRGYKHTDRVNLLEPCLVCNEPYILQQSNIKVVQRVENL